MQQCCKFKTKEESTTGLTFFMPTKSVNRYKSAKVQEYGGALIFQSKIHPSSQFKG
ncbi:hypothetical protein LX69_00260 [Breznakibacter xylanolyticus]|uniref:Uncharacterized protein n=1 Tax=Breznakibacter xylanolyticus TaxID=990 RepID=A0A2W7NL87_9BACT|nr:hypothetical protein LX69_00260 [Breznakibacter xylanolyticus]